MASTRSASRPRRTVALAGLLALAALAAGVGVACGAPEPTPDEAAAVGPASAQPPDASAPKAPHRRGMWVLAEGSQRVLEHPDRLPALIADAQALGVTDLFVQVYRAGRAWYDGERPDATPWRTVHAQTGVDPLALLLERAAAAGLRVHAWVNVLSLATNADAPIVRSLGRDAVLVDRRGRSLFDYPGYEVPQPDRRYYRMGTPGLYLDPAAPGVAEHLVDDFEELLRRYPRLDGLHLDYIRYPDVLPFVPGSRFGVGLDFGYGEATRARFRADTGLEAPFRDRIGPANAWDDWRRARVTALVAAIADRARAVRPDLAISAAVWTYADRAYLALAQDWRGWLEDGLLDFAVPMAYTLDDRLLHYQALQFAGLPFGKRIWMGLGSWLFADAPDRAVTQIGIVRAAGSPAEALFSWDSIVDAPALRASLVAAASDGS